MGRYGFLVPSMDIPVDASGRASTMVYPVHKALVYASTLRDISTFLRSLSPANPSDNMEQHMVKGVIDMPWENLTQKSDEEPLVNPINLNQAEDAIHAFRNSSKLATKYEHSWFGSGLADVSKWVFDGMDTKLSSIQSTLQRLLKVISNNASQALSQEERGIALERQMSASQIASMKRALSQQIDTWAEFAHSDLRDHLGLAFVGKDWKNLEWWKLFWKIDDVHFITSDILQRYWLIQAEKKMIWLSGQMEQANVVQTLQPSTRMDYMKEYGTNLNMAPKDEAESREYTFGSLPPPRLISDISAELSLRAMTKSAPSEKFAYPWPQDISRARSFLSKTTIPPLQALCQGLLLQTISITVLTSSFSAILCYYVSTTSFYEAGAIAAVGFVYSLHRLQKKWNFAKGSWEENVREEGRRILREVEKKMKTSLLAEDNSGPQAFRDEDMKVARKAIERLHEELDKLDTKPNDRGALHEDNGKGDRISNNVTET